MPIKIEISSNFHLNENLRNFTKHLFKNTCVDIKNKGYFTNLILLNFKKNFDFSIIFYKKNICFKRVKVKFNINRNGSVDVYLLNGEVYKEKMYFPKNYSIRNIISKIYKNKLCTIRNDHSPKNQ